MPRLVLFLSHFFIFSDDKAEIKREGKKQKSNDAIKQFYQKAHLFLQKKFFFLVSVLVKFL